MIRRSGMDRSFQANVGPSCLTKARSPIVRHPFCRMDSAMTRCNAGLLFVAIAAGLANIVGCDKRPSSAGTSGADAMAASSTSGDAKQSGSSASSGVLTAHDVLEKMAAAYRSASTYEDFGTLEIRQDPTRDQSETRANFSVTLERPNKLRIEFFNGMVICDGKQWC